MMRAADPLAKEWHRRDKSNEKGIPLMIDSIVTRDPRQVDPQEIFGRLPKRCAEGPYNGSTRARLLNSGRQDMNITVLNSLLTVTSDKWRRMRIGPVESWLTIDGKEHRIRLARAEKLKGAVILTWTTAKAVLRKQRDFLRRICGYLPQILLPNPLRMSILYPVCLAELLVSVAPYPALGAALSSGSAIVDKMRHFDPRILLWSRKEQKTV